MIDRSGPDRSEALAVTALEHANDAIVVATAPPGDSRFTIRYVNAAFEAQTGFARAEVLERGLDVLYGPETDRSVVAALTATLQRLHPVVADLRKYRKDGSAFWAQVSITAIRVDDGSLVAIVVQRDVTERVEAEAELELLSAAMDYANDGIAIFRWDERQGGWRFRHVNEMFRTMTGYDIGELIGRSSDVLLGEASDTELLQTFRAALAAGEAVRGEFAFYRKDGTLLWTELNGKGLRDHAGAVAHSIIVYRDVTEKRRREQRLAFEADHDPLTGIFNRRFFIRALEARLQSGAQSRRDIVFFFDLDGFKAVNDRHGHEAGDRLLIELTTALAARFRRSDVFARLGGDEFAVLLADCSLEQGMALAEDLLGAIRAFGLLWDGHTLGVRASVGVVEIHSSDAGAAEVMRRADEACYAAKRSGRNRVVAAG